METHIKYLNLICSSIRGAPALSGPTTEGQPLANWTHNLIVLQDNGRMQYDPQDDLRQEPECSLAIRLLVRGAPRCVVHRGARCPFCSVQQRRLINCIFRHLQPIGALSAFSMWYMLFVNHIRVAGGRHCGTKEKLMSRWVRKKEMKMGRERKRERERERGRERERERKREREREREKRERERERDERQQDCTASVQQQNVRHGSCGEIVVDRWRHEVFMKVVCLCPSMCVCLQTCAYVCLAVQRFKFIRI